jgi:TIR domain-containing protein/PDZ domain-containing protein
MADVFISYASEDRDRARSVADALSARGWSVWWDRQIPLGKSFDEVIEQQIAAAKCVIVLWSAVSVAKEWVRTETAEGKRRGILLPVFIESVDAPLQFRSLNGADLTDWQDGSAHPEFSRLCDHVAELAGRAQGPSRPHYPPNHGGRKTFTKMVRSPVSGVALAALLIGAGLAAYYLKGGTEDDIESRRRGQVIDRDRVDPTQSNSNSDKLLKDLAGVLGGTIPGTALAKGFYVPDLGARFAFLTQEQSASTLGALPAGAAVMELESGRAVAKAGLQVGDVVMKIAGKNIVSENDLRQAIAKIGPGVTEFSYRRGETIKTAAVNCPACKAE